MNQLNDILDQDLDPTETQEWTDALKGVINADGTDRAHYLLERMVDETRRAGYAISFEENIPNASSIAVPVRGHLGTVVAALGIAGVAPRWNRKRMLEFLPILWENAREIGELLGAAQSAADSANGVRRRASA